MMGPGFNCPDRELLHDLAGKVRTLGFEAVYGPNLKTKHSVAGHQGAGGKTGRLSRRIWGFFNPGKAKELKNTIECLFHEGVIGRNFTSVK